MPEHELVPLEPRRPGDLSYLCTVPLSSLVDSKNESVKFNQLVSRMKQLVTHSRGSQKMIRRLESSTIMVNYSLQVNSQVTKELHVRFQKAMNQSKELEEKQEELAKKALEEFNQVDREIQDVVQDLPSVNVALPALPPLPSFTEVPVDHSPHYQPMEHLLVMLMRLGCSTKKGYLWGAPVLLRRRHPSLSYCFVLFAGAILYWFQRLVDAGAKFEKSTTKRKCMKKIVIQIKMVTQFLKGLSQQSGSELFDEQMAQSCVSLSPFFLHSHGKPALTEDAKIRQHLREIQKNMFFVSPQVLTQLLMKYPHVCFLGDLQLLEVQKRLNNANKSNHIQSPDVLYNIETPFHYDKKNGLIKGLKPRPANGKIQNLLTDPIQIQKHIFSCWIPHALSREACVDQTIFAWSHLFRDALGQEMMKHRGLNATQFFQTYWGQKHIDWNWSPLLDTKIEPFIIQLQNILTQKVNVSPVYYQANGCVNVKVGSKRKGRKVFGRRKGKRSRKF